MNWFTTPELEGVWESENPNITIDFSPSSYYTSGFYETPNGVTKIVWFLDQGIGLEISDYETIGRLVMGTYDPYFVGTYHYRGKDTLVYNVTYSKYGDVKKIIFHRKTDDSNSIVE